eukprot:TRINITY_DN4348_c0_g1_i2.p1 TRINITY_DN4348_c0_g1~~TRINITY_DN4348_c0_g1_i2.p1  ORF type:complete len:530 (+),score=126.94 TRINITY_DN4348_c0_g1_i2:48-1592(+)
MSERGRTRRGAEGILFVDNGANRYRLRNVDFSTRKLSDIQRIIAGRTGEQPATHHFTFDGLRLRNLKQTLQQLGMGHGTVLKLVITKCIVVLTPNDETELRFHGIDTTVCQVGQLRNAVMTRLGNNKPILLHLQGDIIPRSALSHTLSSLGITQGTIIHTTYDQQTTPPPPTSESELVKKSPPRRKPANWPKQAVRLYILTEGIAGKREAAVGAARGEVSKLPLPPIRSKTLLTDVRYLVYDMLGVPPRAQMLFNSGTPLPQYGTQEEVRTTVDMVAKDEDCLTLAIDGSKKDTRYVKDVCPSGNVPWCIHCIVHDADGGVEWSPQFVQPTWEVADLMAMVAGEKGDGRFCAIYFRGAEVRRSLTIQGAGLNEGSVVLALLHETMDVNIDVVLLDGRVLETLIRGVPPESSVSEVVNRSLHATETLIPSSSFTPYYSSNRLPLGASLSSCGLPQRCTIAIKQNTSAPTPPLLKQHPPPETSPYPHDRLQHPSVSPVPSPSREAPKVVRWPPILN